ncbi:Transcriptional regulator, AraC family [Altererythrobacter epoxidivorans]|uniref:Transcriptional regulator, AraC family n=1 Tax=Altererythrobacter epoxidivorans TaxID=361183 RepID=A0A0M4MJD7_9SPHN|nr:helix-turn-helix domain-containing protein [Altererythrobacter epoxidivorans]ALE17968.1 Transcriptional regulator, AraC family [Altererythrobacter epoxidivorans]
MGVSTGSIEIRFALPSRELQPFVTTYYCTTVEAPSLIGWQEDYLHPEWGNIRILPEGMSQHSIAGAPMEQTPAFVAAGPTSRATRFRMGSGRNWGIGLLPLGWAKFIDAPAGDYADRVADADTDPAFAVFRPLADELRASNGDFEDELAIIERHMAALVERPVNDVESITALNAALVDPDVTTVADLAEATGLKIRTLERLSRRAFGFSPKLLIRRQRFLRSLAQFMLDPSLKWLTAMDYHYHDQAHFVRDFKRFMDMTPSAYAKQDHPLLAAAAKARAAIAGEAVQGLHDPSAGGKPAISA